MAKRAQPQAVLKVLVTGGQASPAPPLGPTLSQHRVNIGQFINQFNEQTKDQMGVPLPAIVKVYRDGSFEFEIKTPPASYLIRRAAGIAKGSGTTSRETVGTITREQVRQIAEEKLADLNTTDLDTAMRIIEGTARSCGVEVEQG
ncbi:MAG: 50S ribosomal protein L11 [Planctomycetota bacterium]|jgi:large subunit ribosomal protein L11